METTVSEIREQSNENDGYFELDKNSKGTKNTIENVVKALSCDTEISGLFRYNEFTNRVNVLNPFWSKTGDNLDDHDLNMMTLYFETNYGITNDKKISQGIDIVARQNSFHPVKTFLEGLEWDGKERIGELFPRYLGCDKCEYTTEVTKLFMMGAISRVYTSGCKFEVMPVLVENKQGGGKSTMARFLACKDEWFTDSLRTLEKGNSAFETITGHWICEMSEMLATASAKSVETIKSWLSTCTDTIRRPYQKYSDDIPRQSVIIGTTNNLNFLPKDRTGNRRFLPLLCHSDRAVKHPMSDENETRSYIRQCWAEAKVIYDSGNFELKLPERIEKELDALQQPFKQEDAKVGIIQEWLDHCDKKFVCTQMIYKEAFPENENRKMENWELREIGEIMDNEVVGWRKHPTKSQQVKFAVYGQQRAWDRVINEEKDESEFQNIEAEQISIPF